MKIIDHISLEKLSTFSIGGTARHGIVISDKNDIPKAFAFAEEQKLRVHVTGGGSNTIFDDSKELPLCILKIEIDGKDVHNQGDKIHISFGAGVSWDEAVQYTLDHNASGIEALSMIPGTVGAAPVQNIGAYGQEVSQTIYAVHAYDSIGKKFVTLSNRDCEFSYRQSIFNTVAKNRYVIHSVTFALSMELPAVPVYAGVSELVQAKTEGSLLEKIRESVMELRKNKLPDPSHIPNCGSFFKNPIVANNLIETLQAAYKTMPVYKVTDKQSKLSAGWLIEQLGYKGTTIGPVGIYEKNALVLYNRGGATLIDLEQAIREITTKVSNRFAVTLICEPLILKI
ncbi:UDP-N-acetylmuramate dehydrogenase [Candidatus Nomurabacteria bacterium]|nr:MAG: UDP-N-acetylmuramate dehydrogenase [Candidatus Nomurabacteria bacterium]